MVTYSFAEINVSSSIIPSTYYEDTEDINLVFSIDGGESGNYSLELNTYPEGFQVFGDKLNYCNPICFNYSSDKYIFMNWNSGVIKYKLTLQGASSSGGTINYTLDGGENPISNTLSFSPLSGKPTFDVELIDMNSDESSTEFPKNHRAQVVVKNLNDNEDDIGGEYVKCVYNVVGKSITGQVVGTTPATEINLGSFDMTNLGSAGTYTLNVKCYDRTDNAYFGEENVEFSFLDQQPTASLSFTPETVYPDTSVSCSATGSDVDDPDYIFSFAYSWLLGSTEKSDVNVLNCSTARL